VCDVAVLTELCGLVVSSLDCGALPLRWRAAALSRAAELNIFSRVFSAKQGSPNLSQQVVAPLRTSLSVNRESAGHVERGANPHPKSTVRMMNLATRQFRLHRYSAPPCHWSGAAIGGRVQGRRGASLGDERRHPEGLSTHRVPLAHAA
jgi:hypothetical protein